MHRPQRTIGFGPGQGPLPTGIKWLLITNACVFVLQNLLQWLGPGTGNRFVALFGLVPPLAAFPDMGFKLWQPISYLVLDST